MVLKKSEPLIECVTVVIAQYLMKIDFVFIYSFYPKMQRKGDMLCSDHHSYYEQQLLGQNK
jgi:hypothetical protein